MNPYSLLCFGLIAANFIYAAFSRAPTAVFTAIDRSFFQSLAVFMCYLLKDSL